MEELLKWSDPHQVRKMADKYLGKDVPLYISTKKDKKYMVQNPEGKMIHFGQLGYEDFTKHKNPERRRLYLDRATKMKGKWKNDKYSPNNLSINILW